MAATDVAFYLVVSNIAGRKNLGTYLRTATAFGVRQLIIVGSDRFGTHGAHNAHKYVDVVLMHTFADAAAYLASLHCASVLGLQPPAHELPSTCIDDAVFMGPTAFVLGNEGGGLSEDQRAICTGFLRVDHYPTLAPTVPFSIDLTVQLAIVLQTFTSSTNVYVERAIQDTSTRGKFELSELAPTTPAQKQQIVAARLAKKAQVESVMDGALSFDAMLDDY
ncbi:hypothetical protein SPRG_09205 [Saprolegnia parasitica CBS 223.65]|uniref:tRNA/rRNA methyltransferase SpoU type domain-containing protein n=1 Tax=Saprolegnia parasitica (strain CBS 223.65) TaxID=695850 RepID=A0A067CET4_SAPPC|nr:hypothetical protein SPRG_09205 [Saprolegnia parasitica CBS 223.65]KDO25066.1 hypothetical protein SPRG_09205 [Saprolegnia parasitica CBS 223.65]|eukprot:XP_012204140.1 hypothetical protein SPRG_09205 [Saprolegnia parasitica CBS 223.65]